MHHKQTNARSFFFLSPYRFLLFGSKVEGEKVKNRCQRLFFFFFVLFDLSLPRHRLVRIVAAPCCAIVGRGLFAPLSFSSLSSSFLSFHFVSLSLSASLPSTCVLPSPRAGRQSSHAFWSTGSPSSFHFCSHCGCLVYVVLLLHNKKNLEAALNFV